ncbi:MAG TPA: hypothetical protein VHU43_01475 [Steroidobacteraceae bacterium]|nr:hypothetical protein [Steroidobacteraceae bacterium]
MDLVATHQAFAEFAAQGISMFVSSGDDGAYDANGAFPSVIGDPAFAGPFNAPLTVDAPGDDPYVTSAGGSKPPERKAIRLLTPKIETASRISSHPSKPPPLPPPALPPLQQRSLGSKAFSTTGVLSSNSSV